MSEENRVQDAGRMARMEADISHLTKSFDEFKDETKIFHERQTDMLDELKEGWQKFGGIIQGLSGMQKQINVIDGRVNDLEKWKIAFVAKFSIYSAIALSLGTILAQVIMNIVF